MRIMNKAGEEVGEARSDAEACRWWLEGGRRGDYLEDTGEEIEKILGDIFPDATYGMADGAVIDGSAD